MNAVVKEIESNGISPGCGEKRVFPIEVGRSQMSITCHRQARAPAPHQAPTPPDPIIQLWLRARGWRSRRVTLDPK